MSCDPIKGCGPDTHNLHCGYPDCAKGEARKATTPPAQEPDVSKADTLARNVERMCSELTVSPLADEGRSWRHVDEVRLRLTLAHLLNRADTLAQRVRELEDELHTANDALAFAHTDLNAVWGEPETPLLFWPERVAAILHRATKAEQRVREVEAELSEYKKDLLTSQHNHEADLLTLYKTQDQLTAATQRLDAIDAAHNGHPQRFGVELYAGEGWQLAATPDANCSAVMSAVKRDPDDDRVRVRRVDHDDALLAELVAATQRIPVTDEMVSRAWAKVEESCVIEVYDEARVAAGFTVVDLRTALRAALAAAAPSGETTEGASHV